MLSDSPWLLLPPGRVSRPACGMDSSAVTRAAGESDVEAVPPRQSEPPPTQMLNWLITCVAGMIAERRCHGWPTSLYTLSEITNPPVP